MGRIADILVTRGELDEALRIRREEQLPVYERLRDARSRAVTMGRIADILVTRGELDEALRIRREDELPVYERLGDVRGQAVTLSKIADIDGRQGRWPGALAGYRAALALLPPPPSLVRDHAVFWGLIGNASTQVGDLAGAEAAWAEAVRLRRLVSLPGELANDLLWLASAQAALDHHADAYRSAAEARALARQAGQTELEAAAWVVELSSLEASGAPGLRAARRALRVRARDPGFAEHAASVYNGVGVQASGRGDDAAALGWQREALRRARRPGPAPTTLYTNVADDLDKLGHPRRAVRVLRAGLDDAAPQDRLEILGQLILLALESGDTRQAISGLDQLRAELSALGVGEADLLPLDLMRGRALATSRRHHNEAAAAFAELQSRALALGDPDAAHEAAARLRWLSHDPRRPPSGVLLLEIFPDTPAAAAGLRPGDLVLAYDDQPVPTAEALQAATTATDGRPVVALVVLGADGPRALSVPGGKLGVRITALE